LSSFDRFADDTLLNKREVQDYHSMYIDLYNHYRNVDKGDKVDITDDIVFEMELVKQIEVNIDYILTLIQKYHESNMKDKEILITVNKAIMASPDLRNKKDLIEEFINSINGSTDIYLDFASFMNSKKKEELDKIIIEENLNKDETYNFIRKSFENGSVETNGTEVSTILPPMSRFSMNDDRFNKKKKVLDRLMDFFDKFFSISSDKL
ncbi:MAG TPA: type I restriction endonuclease subunit R, partial [Bacilli bacterium]|nr:type I restriction endonuclease subunit R [Bacilli bacterium]